MISFSRRHLLLATASFSMVSACASRPTDQAGRGAAQAELAALETRSGGRLGVAAMNTANGTWLRHRADERFALCSTFKVIAAAAILRRSVQDPGLLDRRIPHPKTDLVPYSPITQRYAGDGMTVFELCAAAIQYSDNTAANVLMKILGGPAAVTAFARDLGDDHFNLERWETELNTAIPGDVRDTSTPHAMATTLQRLTLGDALPAPQRQQLHAWLRGNTTGAARIRAGAPADWRVADKTGSGDYGTTNDVGLLEPPQAPPIVIALFFTQADKAAPARSEVLAAATRLVVHEMSSVSGATRR